MIDCMHLFILVGNSGSCRVFFEMETFTQVELIVVARADEKPHESC